MGNPSTIWSQLSLPLSAAGSIPYVDSDGITIVTKAGYFWLNPLNYQLSLGTNGDQSGTDSVNIYYNSDAYWPNNSGVSPLGASGTTAAFTVSTSRGSGQFPVISNSGDFIGKFSAWAYTGTTPKYMEMAGINCYVSGSTGSINGAAGELRLFAKPDNVALPVEYIKLTSLGMFAPVVSGIASLGAPGLGWSQIFFSYTNNITPGVTVTCNGPTGRVQLAAGGSVLTVNNTSVPSTAIVIAMVESADATATFIKRMQVANGSFTITMNANATAAVQFSFLVVNN